MGSELKYNMCRFGLKNIGHMTFVNKEIDFSSIYEFSDILVNAAFDANDTDFAHHTIVSTTFFANHSSSQ